MGTYCRYGPRRYRRHRATTTHHNCRSSASTPPDLEPSRGIGYQRRALAHADGPRIFPSLSIVVKESAIAQLFILSAAFDDGDEITQGAIERREAFFSQRARPLRFQFRERQSGY